MVSARGTLLAGVAVGPYARGAAAQGVCPKRAITPVGRAAPGGSTDTLARIVTRPIEDPSTQLGLDNPSESRLALISQPSFRLRFQPGSQTQPTTPWDQTPRPLEHFEVARSRGF